MFKAYFPSIFPLFAISFFCKKRMPLQSGLCDKRLVFLFSFVFFLFSLESFSQEEIPRKKIGLVLSGGGAKGFAHIGVLKVIEQAGIKIDYVGGTSMGAVVGGLYASGYSATQIDSIFRATNFDDLIIDYIPRNSKNFFEKRNDEMYAFTLPINKFKIEIPTALSKGMYNYNLLTKLTHHVKDISDFNKLPIPFICIATDIETGEEIVMNKGYLPQALLASSAFPTIFAPVEINGQLLVDGGVTNNYPVEEVRKLGADIIIGVDVQDDLKDRRSLKEATRILVQISNLQSIKKMEAKRKLTDLYIKPDITKYGVISFSEGNEIINKGEEAGFVVYEKLKEFGISNPKAKITKVETKKDSLTLAIVDEGNLKNYTRSYVIGKLGFNSSSKISYDDLKKGINKLDATQNFSAITYQISEFEKAEKLVLKLTENPNRTFLKLALHYDPLYKSAVLLNFTQKKSLFKNDVISADIILGDNFRYNLDYYIDNGFYFSFGLNSRLNQFNRNVATDFNNGTLFNQLNINTLNVDFLDFNNQAFVQTIFAQKFLLGAGLEWKYLRIKSNTLNNEASVFEDSDYGSIFGFVKYDSFDNKYFPKKGWDLNGHIQSYLYSSDYSNQFNRFSIVHGEASFVRTVFKKATLKLQTEAGFSMGQKSAPYLNFVLGGYGFNAINNFKPFYGYDFVSLSADSYLKTNATIDVEIFKKNHINLSTNFALVEDDLFEKVDWISRKKRSGYALGYGIETLLGPVEFKYSWSPEVKENFYWLSLGFWF
jgi:NTE family protein